MSPYSFPTTYLPHYSPATPTFCFPRTCRTCPCVRSLLLAFLLPRMLFYVVIWVTYFLTPSGFYSGVISMGDLGSIPGLGRSLGEGKDYPLQYSGLGNSMDCVVSPWGCRVRHNWATFTSLHFLWYQDGLCVDVVKIFLMFLDISVLVHHLQFFDEPTTATTFPVWLSSVEHHPGLLHRNLIFHLHPHIYNLSADCHSRDT